MRRGNSNIAQPGRYDGSYSPGTFDGVTQTPPSSNSAEFNGGTIADKVRNSTAYKTAYSIFSQLSDKSWLNRLLAIPTSVEDASSTWFDENGLSNKYNDKQSANYQYCLQQIQNLLAEFYAWKNSLPVTQVDQLQDAGINAAITGEGVSGSELNPSTLQSDPSTLQSSDPMSLLQQFVGTMTSFTGGLTDIVNTGVNMFSKLEDLDIRKRSQIFDFATYLNENGFMISSDGTDIDIDSIIDSFNQSPRVESIRNEQRIAKTKSRISRDFIGQIDQQLTSEVMKDIAQLSVDIAYSQREFQHSRNAYERDYFRTLNPENIASYDEAISNYQSKMSELKYKRDDKFNTMYWDLVDKWKIRADEGSFIHQQLLSQLLTGYSPFMSSMEYIGAGVGVVSDAVGAFTKIPFVTKPKTSR